MCFDTKIVKDHITRDDMNIMEEHCAYLMQSRFDGYKKMTSLMEKINKLPNEIPTPT